ncbi:MAG: prephenate dehydratase [Nocardioides sp.]|nr:prephenate dehydratase [Nocardioides sp.]
MTDTVAFLGPAGTFTHQAAAALRPDATVEPLTSQAAALDAVVSGAAAAAVVPIDNSVNGVVVPTLDALLERPGLSIVESAVVPISFDAFPRGAEPPRVVVSHPHALAQCREWITAHGLTTREASSTAAACRDLEPGEVGLGPAICGSLYGLDRMATAVEDHASAWTQFALVSADRLPGRGAGDEGLLVVLRPDANQPGGLRRLLTVLEERGINMTNLVTRPVPATPGLFTFLLFCSGSFTAEEFAEMAAAWAELGAEARAVGRISPLHELAGLA